MSHKQRNRPSRTPYQYEPLVTPSSWKGEELQYAIRLTQIIDDLYGKLGFTRRRVITTEDVYPVGAIYISATMVNPEELFGGKWKRLEGKFLLAADAEHPAGETGGSATHQLTVAELPKHKFGYKVSVGGNLAGEAGPVLHWTKGVRSKTIENTVGEGQPHSIMPPYVAVYVWERVS